MSRKLSASGDLVLHWPLDGDASDLSGNGYNGTVSGTANYVAGQSGLALDFDGTSTYIDFDDQIVVGTWSLAMWLKPRDIPYSSDYYAVMHTDAWSGGAVHLHLRNTTSLLNADFNSGPDVTSTTVLQEDEWYHAIVTVTEEGGGASQMYINGVLEAEGSGGSGGDYLGNLNFGAWQDGSRYYHGLLDDIRIYDHVLSEGEILGAMKGEIWPYAYGPTPEDGGMHMDTWINLSWNAGGFAVSHDVYLGDNFDAVNEGAEGTFIGNQADTFLVAGFPGFPYPDGLVNGTTYYWRIDEVNDTEPNSPWKGEIWSFMIPPKTAYFPDPADSGETVPVNGSLSWTPGFGAKLHTVYFGDNFDEVNSAAGGAPQGGTTYSPGELKMAKTYYWRVDEFDAFDTYKGNVWSFTTEGAVAALDPANGTVDVSQTPVLTWAPGLGTSHEVYFGADAAALELKGSGNLGSESYDAGQLEWNTTYYWRIDEANNANADSPWTGPLWSFTTANFLIIDDFEAYNDLDEADPESNRLWNVWIDGYTDPTHGGSFVGHDPPPIAEQTIVHGGLQSMPLYYDNATGKSEATLTLTSNRDWTVNGVDTLTIWFRGESSNTTETMYVTLNGS
ncbi:MAG: LamG domain-containing protein, partial [Planctomycetota bacterium]